jgi:hypothetical protein
LQAYIKAEHDHVDGTALRAQSPLKTPLARNQTFKAFGKTIHIQTTTCKLLLYLLILLNNISLYDYTTFCWYGHLNFFLDFGHDEAQQFLFSPSMYEDSKYTASSPMFVI